MTPCDDTTLLRRFAEDGDDSAFSDLVRRHVDWVHSAALRQVGGDTHQAEDVTQAVFLELARQARRLVHHRALAGWLYTTARYMAAKARRAEARRTAREHAAHAMSPISDSNATPDWNEIRPLLDEAMLRLSATDRAAIVLRFFQGQSLARVGEALGSTENAARMRVDRALERLRTILRRRGIVSSAVALGSVLRTHAVEAAPAELSARIALAAGGIAPSATLGSVLAGWASALSWIMTAKHAFTVSAVVVAAAATLPRLRPAAPLTPVFEVTYASPAPPAAPPPAAANAAFEWGPLESGDYRQYVANLRASGAPERLIRDVVALELYRHYLTRVRAVGGIPTRHEEYWRKASYTVPTDAQMRENLRLLSEMRAMLRSLFVDGVSANDAVNLLHCQPNFDSVRLAWLPPEIAARAEMILEPLLDQQRFTTGSVETGDVQERKLREQLAALQDLLTPEQREEYRLRESTESSNVKALLRYWDPTEAEFRALANRHDHSLFAPSRTWEELQERQTKAEHVLGPERASDFLKATDLSYGYARSMAVSGVVASDVPDRVWALKREVLEKDRQLRTDSTLGPAERRQARAALAARARESMMALVGEKGMGSMLQDWAWWQALQKTEGNVRP